MAKQFVDHCDHSWSKLYTPPPAQAEVEWIERDSDLWQWLEQRWGEYSKRQFGDVVACGKCGAIGVKQASGAFAQISEQAAKAAREKAERWHSDSLSKQLLERYGTDDEHVVQSALAAVPASPGKRANETKTSEPAPLVAPLEVTPKPSKESKMTAPETDPLLLDFDKFVQRVEAEVKANKGIAKEAVDSEDWERVRAVSSRGELLADVLERLGSVRETLMRTRIRSVASPAAGKTTPGAKDGR